MKEYGYDQLICKINRLGDENDRLRAQLDQQADAHRTQIETIPGLMKEVERLKADLEARTLRKQTGPVPEDGTYIFGMDTTIERKLTDLWAGENPNNTYGWSWWAGPIKVEEP